MLWLCLRFPLLPLESITRSNTHQPIAVTEQQRVHNCNPAATAQGINAQMPATMATTLCPQLKIIERSVKSEQNALKTLAYWSYNFTPAVTLLPPDSLVLEVQGSLKLFHGLHNLLSHIQKGLEAQGYTCAKGLGPTPKSAFLLTYSNACSENHFDDTTGSFQQRLAFEQPLEELPLNILPCSNALKTKFQRTGFYCLKDILSLPAAAVGKRYGKDFLCYLQQITGQLPDPQQAIELPRYFSGELHFPNGLATADMLVFPMKRLLQSLCGYLRGRQLHCSRLVWQLHQHDHSSESIAVSLAKPQNNFTHFLSLSRLQLESITLRSPLETLALQASDLHLAHCQTSSLFENQPSVDGHTATTHINELLDRLIVRLGSDSVSGLALQDSHIPEQAWQATAPLGSLPTTSNTENFPVNRPTWLLQQPIPIQVRQQHLYWRGRLQLLQGPERIEGNWWHTPVCRDYFIARHEHGATYWIYHDRLSDQWFMHGIF